MVVFENGASQGGMVKKPPRLFVCLLEAKATAHKRGNAMGPG
jgi:hypothetical protein